MLTCLRRSTDAAKPSAQNAYDPHDNIIAGTACMSEMIELFGVPNFLAAYNAGSRSLEDHLRRGRPLPEETQWHLAQIGELPVGATPPGELPAPQSPPSQPLLRKRRDRVRR